MDGMVVGIWMIIPHFKKFFRKPSGSPVFAGDCWRRAPRRKFSTRTRMPSWQVMVYVQPKAGWWQLKHFLVSPLPGEDEPILTNIFQMGWNHQLERIYIIFCYMNSWFLWYVWVNTRMPVPWILLVNIINVNIIRMYGLSVNFFLTCHFANLLSTSWRLLLTKHHETPQLGTSTKWGGQFTSRIRDIHAETIWNLLTLEKNPWCIPGYLWTTMNGFNWNCGNCLKYPFQNPKKWNLHIFWWTKISL